MIKDHDDMHRVLGLCKNQPSDSDLLNCASVLKDSKKINDKGKKCVCFFCKCVCISKMIIYKLLAMNFSFINLEHFCFFLLTSFNLI